MARRAWFDSQRTPVTISELGSLGEFVASLAVLATLMILVFQVRGARKELANQTRREVKQQNNETFHELIRQPGLLAIHIRAQRDFDSLDDQEKLTWMIWIYTWVTQTEDGWLSRDENVVESGLVDRYVAGVASVLRSAGGAVIWPRIQAYYDRRFVEEIDRAIADDDETWLEQMLT